MHELRLELDRCGIASDDPAEGTPAPFLLHLPGGWCEISLRGPGELTVTCRPLDRDLRPDEAIWFALAALDGNGPLAAAAVPARLQTRADAVSRVLGSRGMTVRQGETDDGSGRVIAALFIANPAGQSGGRLTINRREVTWECRFADPGSPDPGLSPARIARAIAAALTGVRDRPGARRAP